MEELEGLIFGDDGVIDNGGMLVSDDFIIPEEEFISKQNALDESPFIKIEKDPRVTKVGRVLRKYSLDELPQLVNILKGDMSVVGNRPLPLYEAERLTNDESIERFMAPAGLTGLWQDKVCLFVICMYCSIHHLSAQQEEQQTQPVQQPLVTQDDILGNMNVDYAKIKLPPLSVLYENARSTPSLQILEKEKLLQKKLLSKEKRNWLGFIQAGGSASYGIADNVASNTDVNTPLIYRYVGTEQTSWNVGGGISIPFEKLFDLRGGIKRQRIQVDIAELRKQEAYETLKIQIAHLYVQILSNIETLQRSAENIALYKGASAVAEQEYRNRRTSIHDVAKTKEQEFAANQDFALLRSTINDQLLTLEIISHTPILTIQGEKDVQETTIQEQEENKRQSKKKDKKE